MWTCGKNGKNNCFPNGTKCLFSKEKTKKKLNVFFKMTIDGYWLQFIPKRQLPLTNRLLRLPADVVSAAAGVQISSTQTVSRGNSLRVTAARLFIRGRWRQTCGATQNYTCEGVTRPFLQEPTRKALVCFGSPQFCFVSH